jgi:hypothetical protein
MDEPQARLFFERLSDTEAPPSRVNISVARRSGRWKLRRRRAAMSGTPVLAVAVLALSAGGVLPASPYGVGPASTGPQPAAVRTFNPLVSFAEFGWLPAGDSLVAGNTARVSQYLAAGPGPAADWSVLVLSAGRCDLSSEQILRQLHHGAHPELQCVLGRGEQQSFTPERQAPSVNGHLAFQADQSLAWEYARNSWAVVQESAQQPHLKLMVKVAAGMTFGHLQPALKFPIQLTGLPAAWRVSSVHFAPDAGVLRGQQLYLTGAGGPDGPSVDIALAGPGSACHFYPNGQSQRRTINGVKVVLTHFPAVHNSPSTFQVCAAHADGLFLLINTVNQQQPSAVSIFRHHLRLLGRDPASWTTSPLG